MGFRSDLNPSPPPPRAAMARQGPGARSIARRIRESIARQCEGWRKRSDPRRHILFGCAHASARTRAVARIYLSTTRPSIQSNTPFWGTGVREKNDAHQIAGQIGRQASRALDFNVEAWRTRRFTKCVIFFARGHTDRMPPQRATLISGGRGRFRAMHIQASFISQTPESMYLYCSQKSTCSCFARAVAVSSRSAIAKCSEIM